MTAMQEFADVLPGLAQRHDHLRAVCRELNEEILATTDKDAARRAAEMLGMVQGGTIVTDLDIAATLVPEFVTHGLFSGGENAVQRFRRSHPQADPERQMLLDAKAQATFTMLGVVETYPAEHALLVEDLFQDNQRLLLADESLSANVSVGGVLCLRMFQVDKFWMSTGLGLSLGTNTKNPDVLKYIATSDLKNMRADPHQQEFIHGSLAATIIKTLLPRFSKLSGGDDDVPEEINDTSLQSERIERNAPCPCGSGKKYKKCCGR